MVASGFTVGKSPTVHKDKLHPCNLLLSGDDACVYVSTKQYTLYVCIVFLSACLSQLIFPMGAFTPNLCGLVKMNSGAFACSSFESGVKAVN